MRFSNNAVSQVLAILSICRRSKSVAAALAKPHLRGDLSALVGGGAAAAGLGPGHGGEGAVGRLVELGQRGVSVFILGRPQGSGRVPHCGHSAGERLPHGVREEERSFKHVAVEGLLSGCSLAQSGAYAPGR